MKMIKQYIAIFCIFISSFLNAQTFPIDTIRGNGNNKLIDIVFLSDGYTHNELNKFISDVNSIVNGIFKHTPLKEYKNFFNVYAIRVPSNESGIKHPNTANDCDFDSVLDPDNYFESSLDNDGIHRSISINNSKFNSVVWENSIICNQKVVLINTNYYGGTANRYYSLSKVTMDYSVINTTIHELGHSFAKLADEYSYKDEEIDRWEAPNTTREKDPNKVKWNRWLGFKNVGIYQLEYDNKWYRPHQNCKMRDSNNDFCPVCTEAFIEKIYDDINPIYSYSPPNKSKIPIKAKSMFSLKLIKPIPNTLKTTWLIDSTIINYNTDSIILNPYDFKEGKYTIKVNVVDTTSLIRREDHKKKHSYSVEWKINIIPNTIIQDTTVNDTIINQLDTLKTNIYFKSEKYKIENLTNPNKLKLDSLSNDLSNLVKLFHKHKLDSSKNTEMVIKLNIYGYADSVPIIANESLIIELTKGINEQVPVKEPDKKKFLNKCLSSLRANEIFIYLQNAIIGENIIITQDIQGYGEEYPPQEKDSPPFEGKDERRRVVFVECIINHWCCVVLKKINGNP